MTVGTIEKLKESTGWSYRRLCVRTGIARASLIRWQSRMLTNEPPVRRPGPWKKHALNRRELQKKVKALEHRRKLTLGSGELYREYHQAVSRREFRHMVGYERREKIRKMRRVEWNVPGMAWSMDDTGRRGLPIDLRMQMNQTRDLCSLKGLSAKVAEKLLVDTEVAQMLESLFQRYGAPLFGKRDNGSNLNGGPVNDVFEAYGVIALNSPPYYARYNGLMEWSQRELKGVMANLLTGMNADLEVIQQAADFGLAVCNRRPRPCLEGSTSDAIFEARHAVMKVYTLQKRREVRDQIKELAMRIMAHGQDGDRLTEQAARRIAVETWLRREGLITITVGGKVLPYYDPLLAS